MTLTKFHQKLSYLDYLVRAGKSGTADELAAKLKISRSTLFSYLSELRDMEITIEFNRYRRTYEYAGDKTIVELFN